VPTLVDLFAGELGWSKGFLSRGWKVIAFDIKQPKEIPDGVTFIRCDVLQLRAEHGRIYIPAQIWGALESWPFDFGVASSPCEEFSLFGMPCFFPNPPYPKAGIELFNHARALFERAEMPYLMENVRAAQDFVGHAKHRCGSFHLWGNGVPPLMPQGIVKGFKHGGIRKKGWGHDKRGAAAAATIPPELSECVASYAERILDASRDSDRTDSRASHDG
jgi:hypothetical protein